MRAGHMSRKNRNPLHRDQRRCSQYETHTHTHTHTPDSPSSDSTVSWPLLHNSVLEAVEYKAKMAGEHKSIIHCSTSKEEQQQTPRQEKQT